MFEAIVTLAHANLSIHRWTKYGGDRLTLYHYGRAIAKLRRAISDDLEYREDAILFSIMALMGVDYLLNNLVAFHANLVGLRGLVALRGGLDALGWPTLLKPWILALESFWSYLSHQSHLVKGRGFTTVTPTGLTDTPSIFRSINPVQKIEEIFPKLPIGFRPLAEKRRLGLDVLNLIHQMAGLDLLLYHAPPSAFIHHDGVRKFTSFRTREGHEITVASNLQLCEQLARLLADPNLTFLEKVCCIGIFIILLGSTRSEQLSPIYFTQLQHHAGELLEITLDDDDPAARDLVAWAIFTLASTMVPFRLSASPKIYQGDLRFALAVKVVSHFSANRTWKEMRESLCLFLSCDACLGTWKNVWDLGMECRYLEPNIGYVLDHPPTQELSPKPQPLSLWPTR